jgi:hypothetical protein
MSLGKSLGITPIKAGPHADAEPLHGATNREAV